MRPGSRARGQGSRAGFTVVEVVVALSLSSVVLGVALWLLWWAASSVGRAQDRLDPQERAHLALVSIREELQDAWAFVAAAQGRAVFSSPRGQGEIVHDAARGRLSLRGAGAGRPVTLVTAGCCRFSMRVLRSGFVRIELELAGSLQQGRSLAPSLSVSDEVFIPAIGQGDALVPWNPADGLVPSPSPARP